MAINPINNGEALSSVRTKLNQAISGVNTLETDKVNKSGDTMTGVLALPANGLTVGTDQVVTSGGNVGIGTNSPSEKLVVNGNAVSTANWAGVRGPTSLASAYKNVWATGFSSGTFLSTNSSGIVINRSGRYYVWAGQRASSTASVFIGIGSDGNRTALEGSTLGVWGHDHSQSPNQWTVSHYIGYLPSGTLLTAGSSGSTSGLAYGSSGFTGFLTAHYIGD